MAGPPDRTARCGQASGPTDACARRSATVPGDQEGGTNKVSDLDQHELFTAQAEEALDEAADRMNWHQVGTMIIGMIQGFPIANRKARRATWPDGKRRACPRR
jgi:hypothetical protein